MPKNCLNYPVELVEDAFGTHAVLAETLKRTAGRDNPRIMIVADLNVVQRTAGLGTKIGTYFQAHGLSLAANPTVLAGGEKAKADDFKSVRRVMAELLAAKLGAGDVVLAIGGGALLDVAGYAAAQVRGGVDLVRMPTTVASMLGAAHADYAAVDDTHVKDAFRVPSAPKAVIIDPLFGQTVLDAVWYAGFGEALRHAVACDTALLKKLAGWVGAYRARDPDTMREIVVAAAASVRKKGPTTLGDWSAQRLQPMGDYKLPHGYAVPIGLYAEAAYALTTGNLKQKDFDLVVGLLGESGALGGVAHSMHLLGKAESVLFGLDAYRLANPGGFTVLSGLGKTTVVDAVDRDAMKTALNMIQYTP